MQAGATQSTRQPTYAAPIVHPAIPGSYILRSRIALCLPALVLLLYPQHSTQHGNQPGLRRRGRRDGRGELPSAVLDAVEGAQLGRRGAVRALLPCPAQPGSQPAAPDDPHARIAPQDNFSVYSDSNGSRMRSHQVRGGTMAELISNPARELGH